MTTQTNVSQQKAKGKIKIKSFSLAKACALGANILLLIALYTGFCTVQGKTLNVLSFIDGILDVFSLKVASMWYYYLSNCAHSILYLITGIACALRFKKTFVFWKRKENTLQASALQQNSNGIIYRCILYFLWANMLGGAEITQFALIACIAAVVGLALSKVFLEIENKKDVSKIYLLTTGGYYLIEGAILFVLALLVSRNVISGAIKGFDVLFSYADITLQSGLYTVYKTLVVEIMYAVLILTYIKSIKGVLFGLLLEKAHSRKKFMKVAIAVLIIDAVVYTVFIARGSSEQIIDLMKGWISLAMTGFLPITLLSVAENMVSSFPSFEEIEKPKQTDEVAAANTEEASGTEVSPENTESVSNVEAATENTEETTRLELISVNTEEPSEW